MPNTNFKILMFFLFFIVISLFGISSNAYSDLNVALTVEEESGVNRVLEPVTFGFPVSKDSNITDVNTLHVRDDSNNIMPAQFRALERWDTAADNSSGKIKWVLVDFQATVSANSTAYYYCCDNGGSATVPTLNVTNSNGVITVNTGQAEFIVDKNNFGIITSAKWNGAQILSNNSDDGIKERNGTNIKLSKNGVPDIFEIEENGQMRMVIHAEGYTKDENNNSGLRYVCRLHFYAGKSYCKVIYYYIHDQNLHGATMNEPAGVRQVDSNLDNIEIKFALDNLSSVSYAIGRGKGETPWSGSLSSGNKYCFQSGFNTYSGSEASGVGKLTGWSNSYDSGKGMMIAVKNFYNKWPHALYLNSNGVLTYKILPDDAGSHDFYIYQAHREEFLIYLHGAERNVSEMQNLAEGFMQDPLFPHPSKSYMVVTKGLGELSPYPSTNYPDFDNSLDDAYNQATANQVSQNMNGRWDYGGLFEEGWSGHPSNYYDGIGVAARQFARTADLKWLKFARNYAENFTSVDQYYCGVGTKDRSRWNGISSGYMGHHHRSGNFIFTSWMEGTLLLYRLTGDEWMWDRGVDLATTYLNRGTNRETSYAWGLLAREGAQAFMTALRVWEINRNSELYTWWTSHADRIVSYQQPNGTFRDGSHDSRHWQGIMNCGPGLYRAYINTGDDNYKNAIINYADAMQPPELGGCMVYNSGNGFDYVERECDQTYDTDNCARTGPRISCVNAYAYMLTGDQKYFNEADRQLKNNWEDYNWENGLGKTANTYHWCMVMEGILAGTGSGGDILPPTTSNHSPLRGRTGFYGHSNIIVHIQDSGDGVDQSSIVMRVNGQTVSPTISGTESDYTLTYDPSNPLEGVVTVTLNARDLANPPNVMPQETYTFTVARVTVVQ